MARIYHAARRRVRTRQAFDPVPRRRADRLIPEARVRGPHRHPDRRDPTHAGRSAKDELAPEERSSRSQFLKLAGGTGAAGALAIFLAACGDDDEDSSSSSSGDTKTETSSGSAKGDLEIVNYALTLEYLEAEFYKQAIASGEVKTKAVAEVAKTIAEDENEHVMALTATVEQLGGKPAAKPKTNFDDVLAGGEKKILETAATVENLGAAAYLGQAGNGSRARTSWPPPCPSTASRAGTPPC